MPSEHTLRVRFDGGCFSDQRWFVESDAFVAGNVSTGIPFTTQKDAEHAIRLAERHAALDVDKCKTDIINHIGGWATDGQ